MLSKLVRLICFSLHSILIFISHPVDLILFYFEYVRHECDSKSQNYSVYKDFKTVVILAEPLKPLE